MPLAIDGSRLLADLHAFRAIGGVGTGVVRRAFSDADLEARRRLAAAFAEAGLAPVWDPVGNLFGLPPGDAPALLLGSHSDTQPEGGWLDGIYGVVVALAVARAAHAAGGPRVAVVSFQDEEGAFAPLMGSRFWAGRTDLPDLVDNRDSDGRRLGDLIKAVPELAGAERVPAARFSGFLEAHIEQGPVLDAEGEAIG
ncbi:MAG: M20/M25/M40 family metallo-hydrolase, partial [Alphaproteobacteria bacterium]|nr:M20/M25/M40 family metallo-hydrolase [Alphaproteobacteria bacterium]